MKKIMNKIGDVKKFSFGEMTSNDTGKTSGSGSMGIYICLIGGICFLLGCLDKMLLNGTVDILTQSIIVISLGAGLLGWRKHKDSEVKVEEEVIESEETKKQVL